MSWHKHGQTFQRILYRLTAGLLVVWLAVFYPALCDYHGLLLFRTSAGTSYSGPTPSSKTQNSHEHAHQHAHEIGAMRHQHTATATSNTMANAAANAPGADPVHRQPQRSDDHKPLAGDSATVSLLSVLTPSSFALSPLQIRTSSAVLAPVFYHQFQHPPPDQPPRFYIL